MDTLLEFAVRGLLMGSVYGLLALPMSLLFLTAGTIDFAVGAYALLAAAVAATVGGLVGLLLGLGAALAAAAFMAGVFLLLRRHGHGDAITVALASFGLAVGIASLVLWQWGTQAFTLQRFDAFWNLAGIRIAPQGVTNLGVGLGLVALLYALLYRTDLGRMMRAAAINPRGAELAAIPVAGVQCGTFLAGGLLAGIAGLLVVYSAGLDFTAPLSLTLAGFGAAIIFGIQSPIRGFLGGLAMGVVEALGAGYTSGMVPAMVPMLFILLVLCSGRGGALTGDRP